MKKTLIVQKKMTVQICDMLNIKNIWILPKNLFKPDYCLLSIKRIGLPIKVFTKTRNNNSLLSKGQLIILFFKQAWNGHRSRLPWEITINFDIQPQWEVIFNEFTLFTWTHKFFFTDGIYKCCFWTKYEKNVQKKDNLGWLMLALMVLKRKRNVGQILSNNYC